MPAGGPAAISAFVSGLSSVILFWTTAHVASGGGFPPEVLTRDLPVMLVLTFALLATSYGFRGPGRINRLEGVLLLAGFIAYQGVIFVQAHPTFNAAAGTAPTPEQRA